MARNSTKIILKIDENYYWDRFLGSQGRADIRIHAKSEQSSCSCLYILNREELCRRPKRGGKLKNCNQL